MSAVQGLIHFFEHLDTDKMDGTKVKLTRSSKSLRDRNSKTVKSLLRDFTEIKRPAGKHRSASETNISDKSQTLPRNFRNSKNGGLTVTEETVKASTSNCSKKSYKGMENLKQREASLQIFDKLDGFEAAAFEQKLQIIDDHAQDIAKKVEDFGGKLRQKRFSSAPKNDEILSTTVSTESLDDPTEICEIASSSSVHDDDEGHSSDDMFGSNNFDDEESDNYIIEAYNDDGRELIMTTLQIVHHTIQQNEKNEDIEKLMNSSDYVFHNHEFIGGTSDSETISLDDDNEKTDSFSQHQTFLYSNFLPPVPYISHSMSENNIFIEQDTTFPKECTSFNQTFYIKEEKQIQGSSETEIFSSNISNYSTLENVISVHDEVRLNKKRSTASSFKKKEKMNFIIEEMKKTEEYYISGLEKVVKMYMPYIEAQTPQDLIGRTAYLFGNIEEIYKNAKHFLKLLEASGDNADSIAQTFIDCASEFELYPLYSKNKPTADLYLKQFDTVIKERQQQLTDKLGLASYLLTPIQRLGKYVLLLEGMLKERKKANQRVDNIESAIKVVRNVMRKGNDYIAIDSIKNSEIDLNDKGSFIMRSSFTISKPRKFTSMVFLFENIVVFTEKMTRNLEHFKYLDSIAMSDLSLGKFEDKPNVFHLTNYTKGKKSQSDASYVLEADLPKTKDEWTETIERILWSQLEKVKEEQRKLSRLDHRHTAKVVASNNTNSNNGKYKTYRTNAKAKSKFYDRDP